MEEYSDTWFRLGNRIAEMRMSRGITQTQLAEMTGLSRVYIGYIEQGKRRGPIYIFFRIVTALGYTLDDLFRENLQDSTSGLLREISGKLDNCNTDEKESINQILHGLLHMMRMVDGDHP